MHDTETDQGSGGRESPADVPAIVADITALIMEAIRRGFGVVTITVHDRGVQVDTTTRRRYERGKKPPAS